MIAAQSRPGKTDGLIDDESLGEGSPLRQGRLPGAGEQPLRKMHAISADVLTPGVNCTTPCALPPSATSSRPARRDRRMAGRAGEDRREFRQQESSTPTAHGTLSRTARRAKAVWSPARHHRTRGPNCRRKRTSPQGSRSLARSISDERAHDLASVFYRSPATTGAARRGASDIDYTSIRRTGSNMSSGCFATAQSTISKPSSSERTANHAGARSPRG